MSSRNKKIARVNWYMRKLKEIKIKREKETKKDVESK